MELMELVGEYLGNSLDTLPDYESSFSEFSKGEVRIYVSTTLSQEAIKELETQILSQGVHLTGPVIQVGRVIIISFEKRIAPLLIIAGVIAAGVGVTAMILGWQIFTTVKWGVPVWAWVAGGGILAYLVTIMVRR